MAVSIVDATPEELALKDQVAKVLEAQGVLGAIKAQLRAAVFQTLHGPKEGGGGGGGGLLTPRPSLNTTIPINASTAFGDNGEIALELVRNLLECLDLEHTLSVFVAEANLETPASMPPRPWRTPSKLCEHLAVPAADEKVPVLIKLLRRSPVMSSTTKHVEIAPPTPMALPKIDTTRNVVVPPPLSSGLQAAPRLQSTTAVKGEEEDEEDPEPDTHRQDQRASPQPTTTTTIRAIDDGPGNVHHPKDHGNTKALQEEEEEEEEEEEDDGDGGEMEASLAEEVASGSFEEESLAEESARSEDERAPPRIPTRTPPAPPISTRRSDLEDEDEADPVIASPPPAPARLGGGLPPLPAGISSATTKRMMGSEEEDDDEGDEGEHDDPDRPALGPAGADDEDFDEDEEAARLLALDAKLKAMEAEDDTGVLQQLKASLQQELQQQEEDEGDDDDNELDKANGVDKGDGEEDDAYGSDFEEEVEEEEEDIKSEMSEDIASVSALSESDSAALAPPTSGIKNREDGEETEATNHDLDDEGDEDEDAALARDRPVETEDALNSYDYIEAVERS